MGSRIPRALIGALVLLLLGTPSGFAAPMGTYKFSDNPATDNSGIVRVTAKAGTTTFDKEFTLLPGETGPNIRDLFLKEFRRQGWTVSEKGTREITISGNGADKIEKVDGGQNTTTTIVSLGGNVTTATATPGDKNFKFHIGFEPGLGADPGLALVELDLDGLSPISQLVPSSPSLAAASFFDVFVALGFPDAELVGNEILFSLLPGGALVTGIESFATDSPALHLSITIPDTVPMPGTLGLLLTASLAAIAGARRRTIGGQVRGT